MLRGRALAVIASVGVLCDALPAQAPFTWLTVPQRDGRRSRTSGATVSVSGDGRYVAFASYARLSAVDTDALADVYVLDRSTTTITLESGSVDGRPLNSDCTHPRISADGRYVAFEAVTGEDPNRGVTDVVLRDRVENTTRQITKGRGGALTNGWSGQAVLDAHAGTIVFSSTATNLLPQVDVNGSQPDIYRFEAGTNAIERISVDSRGVQHHGGSLMPSMSADGRYVAFSSGAALASARSGLERTLTAARPSVIYLRDTRTGQTTLVSGPGQPPNDGSAMPVISANGRAIAFSSRASNLVARDRNKVSDVFLYDVETGTVTLVSRATGGGTANGASVNPAISADGRFVAFQSEASDMACGRNCRPAMDDINLLPDVFIFDRTSGQISCLSLDEQGTWMEESGAPAIDASGGVVAFTSRHPISAGDVLNDFDLFVRVVPQ